MAESRRQTAPGATAEACAAIDRHPLGCTQRRRDGKRRSEPDSERAHSTSQSKRQALGQEGTTDAQRSTRATRCGRPITIHPPTHSSPTMSGYHFTSSAPSAQLVRDVQSINSWPLPALEAFSGVLLAFLGQHRHQEEVLAKFSSEHPALADQSRPVLTSLLHFFSSSIKASAGGANSSSHVRADLLQMGLAADKAEMLSSQFLSSLESVTESALAKTLQVSQLVDIAWKFGVTASGSELRSMGSTFLQLQMTLDRGNGRGPEKVLMELSLPQFYQFLQQMQMAKAQMLNVNK